MTASTPTSTGKNLRKYCEFALAKFYGSTAAERGEQLQCDLKLASKVGRGGES